MGIAQEVEKIMPEVVSTNGDGYKSMDYAKLVPLLIEAIKEQSMACQCKLVSRINGKAGTLRQVQTCNSSV